MLLTTIGNPNAIPNPTALEAVAFLIAPVVGQLTHEAAHYLAAWLLDYEPSFKFRVAGDVMSVEYGNDVPVGDDLLIGLAPTVTGIGFVVAFVLSFGWPPASYWLLVVGLGWVFHSLPSRTDLAGLRQYTGPDEPLDKWEESFWKGFLAMGVGAIVPYLPYNQAHLNYLVSMPLAVAGAFMIVVAVYEKHQAESASSPPASAD